MSRECYNLVIQSANTRNRSGTTTANYIYTVPNWSSIIPEKYRNKSFIVSCSFYTGVTTTSVSDTLCVGIGLGSSAFITDVGGTRSGTNFINAYPVTYRTGTVGWNCGVGDNPLFTCLYPSSQQISITVLNLATLTVPSTLPANYQLVLSFTPID